MRNIDFKRIAKIGQAVSVVSNADHVITGIIIGVDHSAKLVKIKLDNAADYLHYYNGAISAERGFIEMGRYNFYRK
jgi:hypothetical protein